MEPQQPRERVLNGDQPETFIVSEARKLSWWDRRSKLEKSLLYLTALAVLTALCFSTSLVYVCVKYGNYLKFAAPLHKLASKLSLAVDKINPDELVERLKKGNVCMTPGCVTAASFIIKSLDQRTSPCTDFYQFACGSWIESRTIPDDKNGVSIFNDINEDLLNKLRVAVEKPSTSDELPVFKAMKTYFKQCNDLNAIEKVDDSVLKKLLKRFGGWPVIEGPTWRDTHFDWVETILKYRTLGYGYGQLISIGVGTDFRNTERYIIIIGQASLSLAREYLIRNLSDNVLSSYYNLMQNAAVLLGANPEVAKTEMLEVLKFEESLAKLTVPKEQSRVASKFYNKMTLKDLTSLAPKIPWKKMMKVIFAQPIGDKEEVIVSVPDFVRKVQALIEETPKRVLSNYLLWRIVRSSMSLMGKKWRNLLLEYSKGVTGVEKVPPRWKTCINEIHDEFGIALSSLYVRSSFKRETKATVSSIVKRIYFQFQQILKSNDWMDAATKKEALAKAGKMKFRIAYPEELIDDTKLSEFYEGIEVDEENSWFNNALAISLWETEYTISFLRKKNDKNAWWKYGKSAVVNAYYRVFDNTIFLPAGILSHPFYREESPRYLNFGSIGVVVGHEVTHGFDDVGRQFDKNGNNVVWWTDATDAKFKDKAKCIISQYGNYTVVDNVKINGINTQGENIADNGGLKEAYYAYKEYVKEKGAELPLPGLKYTPEQLFFISFANVWCRKVRPKALRVSTEIGVHSPAKFRVIGTLSNSPEFAAAFHCQKGSQMNPHKKCSVW